MATVAAKPITAAEFAALNLDVPAELVQGEIIEICRPGMRHGVISSNVTFLLMSWNRSSADEFVVVSDSGILTERDPDTVRGPDLYFIQRSRLPPEGVIPGFLEIPPDLCVEIFSPNDNWKDVIAKVDEYLQAGVQEVWVVEPDEGQTYIYRPDAPPRTIPPGVDLESGVISGLKISYLDVFRDIPATP